MRGIFFQSQPQESRLLHPLDATKNGPRKKLIQDIGGLGVRVRASMSIRHRVRDWRSAVELGRPREVDQAGLSWVTKVQFLMNEIGLL
jgi:hypothetical protein